MTYDVEFYVLNRNDDFDSKGKRVWISFCLLDMWKQKIDQNTKFLCFMFLACVWFIVEPD